VYNSQLDKRFSEEVKTEEDYDKYIKKIQVHVLSDYHTFLEELDKPTIRKSLISKRLESNQKKLDYYRNLLGRKMEYLPEYNLKKSVNTFIDHYENLYRKELKNEMDFQLKKNHHGIEIKKELDYYLKYPERPIKDFSPSNEDYKKNLISINQHTQKAVSARDFIKEEMSLYEKKEQIEKDPENLKTLNRADKKLIRLEEKLNDYEAVTLYNFGLLRKIKKLATLDTEFRKAAKDLDLEAMKKKQKFLLYHAEIEFLEISKYPKFKGSENELKNSALRLVKYYLNIGQKSYQGIIKFTETNLQTLIQERKNMEEYKTVVSSKKNFYSKEEYLAYKNNLPSQKLTEKYNGLTRKYVEKLRNNVEAYILANQNTKTKYTKNLQTSI
jgi:hypothetical protein